MRLFNSLKSFALVLAVGSFALAANANAYHDDPEPGEVFLGIIGSIMAGALDAREARRDHYEYDRYCRRLARKCDWGRRWACRKYRRHCEY